MDTEGARFWHQNFGFGGTVTQNAFVGAMQTQCSDRSISVSDVLEFVLEWRSPSQPVYLLEFELFLKRFGPLRVALAKAHRSLFRQQEPVEWFHGTQTRDESEDILSSRQAGRFLVRYSEQTPQYLTLCYVSTDLLIKHVRIFNYGESGYGLQPDPVRALPEERFDSIMELIDRHPDRLSSPCISQLYQRVARPRYADASVLGIGDVAADRKSRMPPVYGARDRNFAQVKIEEITRRVKEPEAQIPPETPHNMVYLGVDNQSAVYAPTIAEPLPSEQTLEILLNLAKRHMLDGQYEDALQNVARVISTLEEQSERVNRSGFAVRMKAQALKATAFKRKAEVLSKIDRKAEAVILFRESMMTLQALHTATEALGGARFAEAMTLHAVHVELAKIAFEQEDYQEWMYHLEQQIVFDEAHRERVVKEFADTIQRLSTSESECRLAGSVTFDAAFDLLEDGRAEYRVGNHTAAQDRFEKAARYARLTGNGHVEARALSNLATIYREREDWVRAAIFYKACQKILKRQDDTILEMKVLYVLVTCLMKLQLWRDSIEFLERHVKLSQRPQNKQKLLARRAEIAAKVLQTGWTGDR